MAPRIDLVEITGVFRDSDPPAEVQNNVWVIGDDDEVIVIDASHDASPIVEAVGGRRVTRIQCSHGHFDHVNVARSSGNGRRAHRAASRRPDAVGRGVSGGRARSGARGR